tara:strand:- start:1803 stop:2438 length:636 start_codon:yes stop_codon:yes gene_type:complete
MNNLNLKKAAMFGLDARIALAIFGALSVISGAALYSAIQSAQAESWRQYFTEIVKATEAYYLDNGKQIPMLSAGSLSLYTGDIGTNRENLTTWNGPYIQASSVTSGYFQDQMTSKIISNAFTKIFLRQGSTWTEMDDTNADEFCVSGNSDCYEWITISPGSSSGTANLLALFNMLDNYIDGGDGALDGTVRYNTSSSDFLMFKGMPHKYTS